MMCVPPPVPAAPATPPAPCDAAGGRSETARALVRAGACACACMCRSDRAARRWKDSTTTRGTVVAGRPADRPTDSYASALPSDGRCGCRRASPLAADTVGPWRTAPQPPVTPCSPEARTRPAVACTVSAPYGLLRAADRPLCPYQRRHVGPARGRAAHPRRSSAAVDSPAADQVPGHPRSPFAPIRSPSLCPACSASCLSSSPSLHRSCCPSASRKSRRRCAEPVCESLTGESQ